MSEHSGWMTGCPAVFQVTPNVSSAALPARPNLSAPAALPCDAPTPSPEAAAMEPGEAEEEGEGEEPCVSALQLLGGDGEQSWSDLLLKQQAVTGPLSLTRSLIALHTVCVYSTHTHTCCSTPQRHTHTHR